MSIDVQQWAAGLDELGVRVGHRFGRVQPRRQAMVYVRGLLAGLERKNGWTLAEFAGDACPDAMQRLLRRARWDADALRDDLREYVVEHLGDRDAVLVVDETGFLKKGVRSAGGAAAVLRDGGPDRELPDRYVPCLCLPARPRADRPGTLYAQVVAG